MSHDARDLLPCPFCGGAAVRVDIESGENSGGSCIACTKCQASSNVEFEFKENFVSKWNTRATLSPMGLLEEVRDALESLPDDIEIFRSLCAAGKSNRAKMLAVDSLLQPARALLAKLPKLTGEGM